MSHIFKFVFYEMYKRGHWENLKPIFHCEAKTFALGPQVGLAPNVKFRVGNTNMLVSRNAKI